MDSSSLTTASPISDPFVDSDGPIMYMQHNRTKATVEFDTLLLLVYVFFISCFIALIIVLPSMRKDKWSKFINMVISLSLGTAILIGLFGSSWHVGQLELKQSPYSLVHPQTKFTGDVGVQIGLWSVNVTLVGTPISDNSPSSEVYFNEQFHWSTPDEMSSNGRAALARGLPHPIITSIEYLSIDQDGFSWARQYRLAGYYTRIALFFALAAWCTCILMKLFMSEATSFMTVLTCCFMLLSTSIYAMLAPEIAIHFYGAQKLRCSFGVHFWLIVIVALIMST